MRITCSVVVVVLLGLAVRLIALWAAQDVTLLGDENAYLYRAQALLDGRGFLGTFHSNHFIPYDSSVSDQPGAYQPPGYTLFLAMSLWLTGPDITTAKIPQVLLSAFTVLLVYWIGRAWFDHWKGLVAAIVCALYPNLIAFSHLIWSETLYICLFLTAILLVTRTRSPAAPWAFMGSGFLLGLAALTRSSLVYFLPLLMVWVLLVHRKQWKGAIVRCGLLLGAAVITILPWTIRNYVVHDGFVLIDTSGPYTLWRGNAPETFQNRGNPLGLHYDWPLQSVPMRTPGSPFKRDLIDRVRKALDVDRPSDLQIVDYALRSTRDWVQKNPLLLLKRIPRKIADMWNPSSVLLRHFAWGAYGEVNPILKAVVSWAAIIGYLLVCALSLIGMGMAWKDRHVRLVILLILFHTLLSAAAFGLTRFRLPVMPFLILLSVLPVRALHGRRPGGHRDLKLGIGARYSGVEPKSGCRVRGVLPVSRQILTLFDRVPLIGHSQTPACLPYPLVFPATWRGRASRASAMM